jgi:hypothetical protein
VLTGAGADGAADAGAGVAGTVPPVVGADGAGAEDAGAEAPGASLGDGPGSEASIVAGTRSGCCGNVPSSPFTPSERTSRYWPGLAGARTLRLTSVDWPGAPRLRGSG